MHYAFAARPDLEDDDQLTLTMELLYADPGSMVFAPIADTFHSITIDESNLWLYDRNFVQSPALSAKVEAGGKLLAVAFLKGTPGAYGTHSISFTGSVSVA